MSLSELVSKGGVVVLSGAGLSTESGIPDYRGATGSARPSTPMTYQAFTGSSAARQRYWARSHLGWRFISRVHPNAGHLAVARLQEYGLLTGNVTQNVDGLHQGAGAKDVLELHGALDRVVCLTCRILTLREELERRLTEANPGFTRDTVLLKPDGDVDLEETASFTVVDCAACGGLLKPDVVFFGETVPQDRVTQAFAWLDTCSCLLVLGSSLTVMSGYRFVLHAAKHGVPIAIINQGPTRGDKQASIKVDGELTTTLTDLADALAR